MGFISVLLLAIAMTVIQISHTYNRGLTLKDVNQSGRAIASDLRSSISESASFVIESGTNNHFIKQDWGGRLCTGKYSYVWNYGFALAETYKRERNDYSSNEKNLPLIHFVRVMDNDASYCRTEINARTRLTELIKKTINQTQAAELLVSSDHNLAIHKFDITSGVNTINPDTKEISNSAIDKKTGARLYSLTFYIGTNNSKALKDNFTACKGPGETAVSPTTVGLMPIVLSRQCITP